MTNSNAFSSVNPELAAMKEDVANRVFRLKTIETVINLAALVLVGVGLFALGGAGGMAGAVLPLAFAAAAGVGSFVTMKERKRLEIDQEFLQSRMQGGNWWGGYREQVMERGGSAPQEALSPSLPGQSIGQARGK